MNVLNQQKLAYELADSMNDRDSIQVYISFTQKFSEEFLRKIQNKVLSIPEHKIKKSRGALFTFLVQQHGKNSNHFRD